MRIRALLASPTCRGACVSRLTRERARHLRRHPTDAERRAWELLRARRCLGLKFRRQQPLAGFIVDFYCPKLDLAIELDGDIHDSPDRARYDCVRDRLLALGGTIVIRIRNEELTAERLKQLIAETMHQRRGTSAPA